MKTYKLHFALVIVVLSLASNSLYSVTAWLPKQNQLVIRPVVANNSYSESWLADKKAKYDDTVVSQTAFFTFDYAFKDDVAVDFSFGYGRQGAHQLLNRPAIVSEATPAKTGWLDTQFGLRHKLTDEWQTDYDWLPTISWRVGAIIAGSYDNQPQALGDGASGFETNLYLMKHLPWFNSGFYGDLAYRNRSQPVPQDVLYASGLFFYLPKGFMANIGYRGQLGLEGYAFANGRAPQGRREDFHNLEAGIGYGTPWGGFYQLFVSKTTLGYNTADRFAIGLQANILLQL